LLSEGLTRPSPSLIEEGLGNFGPFSLIQQIASPSREPEPCRKLLFRGLPSLRVSNRTVYRKVRLEEARAGRFQRLEEAGGVQFSEIIGLPIDLCGSR